MCLSHTYNLPYQKLNHLNTYWHVLPIVTQEERNPTKSIQLLPKRLRTAQIYLQIKYWNEIQCVYKVEDHLVNPSYHQINE